MKGLDDEKVVQGISMQEKRLVGVVLFQLRVMCPLASSS